MKRNILFILLLLSTTLFAQDTFQLAPPLLQYGSIFFVSKTEVIIKFAQAGSAVHYTLNGNEPTDKDPIYTKPVIISKNFTTVRAKAFGKNFRPSEIVGATFIKDGIPIKSIDQTNPNEKYPGTGNNTLIDNKGGIEQSGSDTWMGYNCDKVSITIDIGKKHPVKMVLLNLLESEKAWIFLPEQILVYSYEEKSGSFVPFGKETLFFDETTPGTHCDYRIINGRREIKTSKLLIDIYVMKHMPDWHPSKGEHAWLFIDEIKVY